MEGTVRFLLISILATAAASKYEYDESYVQEIQANLQKLEKCRNIKFHNLDDRVQWKVSEDTKKGIVFNAEEHVYASISAGNCGGRPAFTVENGPMHCLFEMMFQTENWKGREILQLGLIFMNSADRYEWRLIHSDVLAIPRNGAQKDVVHVEPITKELLETARLKGFFSAEFSWLQKLVERGLRVGKLDYKAEDSEIEKEDSKTEGSERERKDSKERDLIVYTTYPIVMDPANLEKILK